MAASTRPIYDIITAAIAQKRNPITYTYVCQELAAQHQIQVVPIGLGSHLTKLANLLDRTSDRSGLVIPPLTSVVTRTNGPPGYGVNSVFAAWLRRRPGTSASLLRDAAASPGNADPMPHITILAQTETRHFGWSAVPGLISDEEWLAA